MYPPILVLVLALVTFSKQALSLSQFDGDDGGGGEETGGGGGGGIIGLAGDDFSSPQYDESYTADSLPLDGVYYRVDEGADDSDRVSIASSSSTSTSTTTTSELPATAVTDRSSSGESNEDHITDSDGKISVAQPFIADHHHHHQDPVSNRSRSLDHDAADSLQSSTVLETSLASNFLYTSSSYNDSGYHPTASISDSDVDSDAGSSSLEDLATTTNLPPLAAIPDDVVGGGTVIKPTKPHFDESKISKSELLARMIGDKNLRLPIAILVDTCNDSLSYSKKVFDASLVPKSPLNVILMRYNSTAIAKSTSFRNTKSLMDAINSLQPSYEASGRGYYGIMRTAQEIPYDSAIFLATSNAATDQELSKMAAITLLKKRIRLYVIWFSDEEDSTLSDQHLDSQTGLHELAYKTGGRVIRFELDRHFGNNPVLTTLVSEDDLHGTQSIPIPVGEDVNSIYLKLQGSLESATLRTPNGD